MFTSFPGADMSTVNKTVWAMTERKVDFLLPIKELRPYSTERPAAFTLKGRVPAFSFSSLLYEVVL